MGGLLGENTMTTVKDIKGTVDSITRRVSVEILPSGYRVARFSGCSLVVRPDGSESFSNVQPDSETYAFLNFALFNPRQEVTT